MTENSDSIIDNIFKYRLQTFLSSQNIAKTGNITELKERIEENLTINSFKEKFLDFLEEELHYGKNKQLFYCDLPLTDISILNNLTKI